MRDWAAFLREELDLPRMREHREDRMIEELADHLEDECREAIRSGMAPEEAERHALESLGDLEAAARELRNREPAPVRSRSGRWVEGREEGLRSRGWVFLSDRLRDFRLAARSLGRRPVFSVVVVLVLALGIGGTTAIFTLLDSIVLSPLPFEEQERLVSLSHTAPEMGIEDAGQTAAWHFTYEDGNSVFDDIGLWTGGSAAVTGAGDPETVSVLSATSGLFRALRLDPVAGRSLTREDEDLEAASIALLGYGYWQTRFGGDPDVLGRTLQVNGTTREIAGVMPPELRSLGLDPAIILPLQYDQSALFVGNIGLGGIARLSEGVTIEQATADLTRLMPSAWDRYPGGPLAVANPLEVYTPIVESLKDDLVGSTAGLLWFLLGGVGVVLLIACANVANLFLVRSEGLETEMAVRTAMGAGRRRINWEYLKESILLGLLGGVGGIALSYWGVRALVALGPGLPRLERITTTPTALLFALVVSLGAGAFFGMIPGLRHGRRDLLTTLRGGGSGGIGGKDRRRAQNVLVVAQIAMTVVLLVGSGLLLRSFSALRSVDPGFGGAEDLLAFRVNIPFGEVPEAEGVATMHERIARRVAEVPGVESVGLATAVPMDGSNNVNPFYVDGFAESGDRERPMRRHKWVGEGFFETMQIPLLTGRTFTWDDVHARFPGAIVSESMAREYWGSPEAALGQRVSARSEPVRWHEIVGVVGNVRDDGVDQDAPLMVYWPQVTLAFWRGTNEDQVQTWRSMAYAVRSQVAGSESLIRAVHEAVWDVNPSLPLQGVRTVPDLMANSMARTSFTAMLIGVSGLVALILGIVGVYGVVSYAVTQRSREFGMRMALGAAGRDLMSMVVRQGLALAVSGAALGLVGVLVAGPLIAGLLYGITPRDPATLILVPAGLLLVALLASYVPARRAARVDPMEALRGD